jgi:hypothetical protein
MPTEDEEAAALAIALHVNFRRHCAKSTLSCLIDAVKQRHAVANAGLQKLAWLALTAWFSKPVVKDVGEVSDLPTKEVLDWCGNDFGVYVDDVDPWVEIVQEVGNRSSDGGVFYEHMPKPPVGERKRAAEVSGVEIEVKKPKYVCSVGSRLAVPAKSAPVDAGCVGALVDEHRPVAPPGKVVLEGVRRVLGDKLAADQAAAVFELPMVQPVVRHFLPRLGVGACPVRPVDPVAAIRSDLVTLMKGLPGRDAVATGYRLAEVDIDKLTTGNMRINDSKRVIPAARYVRRPILDAGVEGNRVPSQASLIGAVFKRNVGVPANRVAVNLEVTPARAARAMVDACFIDDWREVLALELNSGLWEPTEMDIDDFVAGVDTHKIKDMVEEFFMPGQVRLDRWLLMAKGKVKPSREEGADLKVDHAQTIMYLESKCTNAMYSSVIRRVKKVLDACLRPNVVLNAQRSDEEHEAWSDSMEGERASHPMVVPYVSDIRCYDRSQDSPGLLAILELYKLLGLDRVTYDKWIQMHGPKRAMNMAFGIVLTLVLGGISGNWETLFRNGLYNMIAFVVSGQLSRRDIVTCDVKGDDMVAELSKLLDTAAASATMSDVFNLSAKLERSDQLYMCKQFRMKLCGKWYHVADPWPKVQSLCTPMWVGDHAVTLGTRWVSLVADLRHYDNGILVDAVATAAAQWYGVPDCFSGMATGLAAVREDRSSYFKFFSPPELVS